MCPNLRKNFGLACPSPARDFFCSQFPRVHYLVWWVTIKGYRIGVSFWVRVSFGVMIRVRVDVMVRIRVSKLLGSD